MDKKKIIENTRRHVKKEMEGEGSGHDWWHVYRVWKNAIHIGKKEDVDMFVVELGALLHDIADFKFHDGDASVGPRVARQWLESQGVEDEVTGKVCDIVENVSFKGAKVKSKISTKEGMVVQDADRLDAIGAIGIARVFAYGGANDREIHSPKVEVVKHETFEDYKSSESTGINHFYEKLLLLKGRMKTETGKEIAEERHKFMEEYLERFYKEWDGKL